MQDHSPALPGEYSERAAVAAVLMGRLSPRDLSRELLSCPRELEVYDAVMALREDAEITPFLVRDYMGDRATVVGPSDIEWATYADAAAMPHEIPRVLAALRYAAKRRYLDTVSDQLRSADPSSARQILEHAADRLGPEATTSRKSLSAAGDEMVEQMQKPGRLVPAPWPRFEEACSVGPAEVCVIGALPGYGKSAVVQQWGEHTAGEGHPVLFVSMEMPAPLLAMRAVARYERISIGELRSGSTYATRAQISLRRNSPRLLEIVDDVYTVDEVCSAVDAWASGLDSDGPTPMVIVDHLQHFTCGPGEDMARVTIDGMAACNRIAKKHGMAVIALSQFANVRDIMSGKRPPRSSDLWGGSALWHRATTIVLLDSDADGDRRAAVRPVRVIVDKARHGVPGTEIGLSFEGAYATFSERNNEHY